MSQNNRNKESRCHFHAFLLSSQRWYRRGVAINSGKIKLIVAKLDGSKSEMSFDKVKDGLWRAKRSAFVVKRKEKSKKNRIFVE
jgi:hypothetical protein